MYLNSKSAIGSEYPTKMICVAARSSRAALAQLLGVDEKHATEFIRELQNAGYENIFCSSEETKIHD